MIRVTVKKRENSYVSFHSKGHAGYADSGKDIVCAAVSALIITTVNSLEAFTEDEIDLEEKSGEVFFPFPEFNQRAGDASDGCFGIGSESDPGELRRGKYLEVITKEV